MPPTWTPRPAAGASWREGNGSRFDGFVTSPAATAVTAVATLSGAAASAGLLYAAMGVGSALTGLATSALPVSFRLGDLDQQQRVKQ